MANKKNVTKKKKQKRIKDPHETLTLKYWLIGAAIVLLVVGLAVGGSILAAHRSIVDFHYENGVLTRGYDGRMFLKADEPFEVLFPVSRDQKGTPYGKSECFNLYKVGFYNQFGMLKEMDDENYLTDGVSFYYGNYVAPPTLEKFEADTVRIGEMTADEKTRVYLTSFSNVNAPDATDFVNEYLTGKTYVGDSFGVKTYCVQLTSSKYNYLAYMLYLVQCEDGSWYMYTKSDRTSIQMDSRWFESLLDKTETTTSAPDSSKTPVTE